MREALSVFLLLLGIAGNAQESVVASHIRKAYRLAWAEGSTFDDVRSTLSGVSESDILNEGDSIKYFFYYLEAALLDSEERDLDLRDRYIDEAITLREKSVGVLSSEYLELLWAKSDNLMEYGRKDEAMRLCQKGLVTGHELVEENYPAARRWYGELMRLLGELYISKGYDNQVVSLYNESFDMLQDRYDEDNPTSWLPLMSLYVYYYQKGMYEEAYKTNERIGEHIRVNGGESTRHYAATYKYQRGNMLYKLGRIKEAAESYREGVGLLINLGLTPDKDLGLLYGNWQSMLVERGMFQEADAVQKSMTEYFSETSGKANRLYPYLLNGMAVSFLLQGEGERPVALLEEAFEIYRDLGMQHSVEMATLEHNLGRAYMLCGKYKEAHLHLSKSAELQQAVSSSVMDRTVQYLKETEEMK